jgi:hypothetical protein
VARWDAIVDLDHKEGNRLFDQRAEIEKELLQTEEGRKLLTPAIAGRGDRIGASKRSSPLRVAVQV